jgi:hypothetical protein
MGKSVFLNIALIIIISQIGYLQLLNINLEHNRYNSLHYNNSFIPLPLNYEIWDPGMNHSMYAKCFAVNLLQI